MTPLLRLDQGDTSLVHLDIAGGRRRLGASALAQVYGQLGNDAPDVDASRLAAFFALVQRLRNDRRLLAYHDVSDGGVFVTLAEMAFASRCGLAISLSGTADDALAALFAEELGAVVQVRDGDVDIVCSQAREAGIAATRDRDAYAGQSRDGSLRRDDRARRIANRSASRMVGHDACDAADARQSAAPRTRNTRALGDDEPGLVPTLTFDPDEDVAAPFIATGVRPRVAVLREQGVNGQVEMAAALTRAGFDAFDVHMTDVAAGRHELD